MRGAFAAEPIPVAIANASGNLNLTMQELMKQQGYLQEMGLAGTITNVADGSKITGGLIGGDVDVSTMAGFGQVFPAIERGAKLKIIAGACLLPLLALYSSKPGIKTLKDLEGRTVGTGALGALLHQLVVALLQKNGVDIAKVSFVNVGASGDVFRAASMGTVDAGTGEAAIADQLGRYNVHMIEGGDMATGLPEYTYQGAYTTDKAIATKRDVIVRTLAAYAKLYRLMAKPEGKEAFLKARAEVLKSSPSQEGESQWSYLQQHKPFTTDLLLSEERLAYMQRLNVQLGTSRALADVQALRGILNSRDGLSLIGAQLPGHITSLTGPVLESVKAHLDSPMAVKSDLFLYSLVLVMSKLAAPWQLLRLATRAANTSIFILAISTPVGHSWRQALQDTQSFRVSAISSDASASGPNWPEIASRKVLARPRVTSFSLRVAR